MKNSFYLVIPKQEASPQRVKEYEAKALQQWINELPAANPGLATRLLHDLIIDLNSLAMTAELRVAALEQLRPNFLAIEENLRTRLTKNGFPKDENEQKVFNVLVSIEKEFTLGYWIALKELAHKETSWFQGKYIPLSLYRCISGLSNIVICHYLMRMPVPDWIWIDLHSLYKLGVSLKKDTVKVTDDPATPNIKITPGDSYKQILLLSLCAPNGLLQRELLVAYHVLSNLCTCVNIKNTPISGQQLQCIIPTDEDKAPYFLKDTANSPDSAALYIDFTKFNKNLEQTAKQDYNSEGRFAAMLTRQSELHPSFDLLEYIFHRLNGYELESTALFSDRLDRSIIIGMLPTYEAIDETAARVESSSELIVQTASECLLSGHFEHGGLMSVGRLVSIKKLNDRDESRCLGIVNQLSTDKKSNNVIFGVQFVTSEFHAVTYNAPDSLKTDEPVKALFYTAEDQGVEKNYLITDNFVLKDGDFIRIFWKNDDYAVSLSNRKNIGLGYWQLQCTKIIEKNKPSSSQKGYDFI